MNSVKKLFEFKFRSFELRRSTALRRSYVNAVPIISFVSSENCSLNADEGRDCIAKIMEILFVY